MVNEKLVGNVYFRGSKIGSSELSILDTSNPPNYDITFKTANSAVTDLKNLFIGLPITMSLKQNPVETRVTKVYYKFSGTNADRFGLTVNGTETIGAHEGVANLTAGGVNMIFRISHYPSIIDTSALVELFHDAERKVKFGSFDVTSKKVTNPVLRLIASREASNADGVASEGIFNNDVMLIDYTDSNVIIPRKINLPFNLYVDNVLILPASYPATGVSWFSGVFDNQVFNFGANEKGVNLTQRQKNAVSPGNKTVRVTMGDLTISNNFIDADFGTLVGEDVFLSGSLMTKPIGEPFPAGINSAYNKDLSLGYGFTKASYTYPAPPTGLPVLPAETGKSLVSSMITRNANGQSMEVLGHGETVPINGTSLHYVENSAGDLTYLAWNAPGLDTAKKRAQFGKYQQTLRLTYKFQNVSGSWKPVVDWTDFQNLSANENFNLAMINNPIATSQYGALTRLSFSDLAAFVFNARDVSIQGPQYELTGCVKLGTTTGMATLFQNNFQPPTPVPDNPAPMNGRGRMDVLFLRLNGPSQKNTFEPDTPYPRIVNVQNVRGYEAFKFTPDYGTFWEVSIDPSLGIDLTDGKYQVVTTVQNDSSFANEWWVPQYVYMIAKSPTKMIFRAGWYSADPTLSVAIIETGPDSKPANTPMRFRSVNRTAAGWAVAMGAGLSLRADINYGEENIIIAFGRVTGASIKLLGIENRYTNAGSKPTGTIAQNFTIDYYTSSNLTTLDTTAVKAHVLYARVEGQTLAFTRVSSRTTTDSRQIYQMSGMDLTDATSTAWDTFMKKSLVNPTAITFSAYK